jgi:hypothetical protein
MATSMPVSRPRRKSGAVTSCPKDTGGAELHNPGPLIRGRKRAALTAPRASAEPGTKRGRFGWWASWVRKDDGEETPSPELEPAVAGREKNCLAEIRMEAGRDLRAWLACSDGLTRETQAELQGSFSEHLAAADGVLYIAAASGKGRQASLVRA